jgi:hypothetical protein
VRRSQNAEEEMLAGYIRLSASCGRPLLRQKVCELARQLAQKAGRSLESFQLGKKGGQGFLRHWPDIKKKWGGMLSSPA